MIPWKGVLFTSIAAAALSAGAVAQTSSDPVIGTWVLNVAKSKFEPGPAPKSETWTFESAGAGILKLTVQIVTTDGQTRDVQTSFPEDGTPAAISGNPDYDQIAVQRINSRETRIEERRGGEVVGHSSGTVFKDGKTMRYTQTYTSAAGTKIHSVLLFDRQ